RAFENRRIKKNKVLKDINSLGQNTLGWFYGFEH
ncbi:MAG: hypothetical protein ACI83B_003345, partial [Sediminicola sp.]